MSQQVIPPRESLLAVAGAIRLRWVAHTRKPTTLLGLTFVLCLPGCAVWMQPLVQQDSKTQLPAQPDPAPSPTPRLSYQYPDTAPVVSADELRSFVARYRHQVVVLNFWANWSDRSVAELRGVAQEQEQLFDQGLQVISCNLDDPRQWRDRTLPNLKKAGGNYPCLVLSPEAKSNIRTWLNPKWSYDLPARFVLDGQGRVVAQALSGATMASVGEQVRKAMVQQVETSRGGPLPADSVALRARLIDVRTGQGQSLAEVTAHSSDAASLGEKLAILLAARLTPGKNPRIAVLPFPSSRDRHRAGEFGQKTAESVTQYLRLHELKGTLAPTRAQEMFDGTNLTPMLVDFDPSTVVGRLACDYLVIGWLRGVDDRLPNATLAGPARD